MKTQWLKKSEIEENWYLIDASSKVLGRLACFVANVLQGKNDVRFLRGVNLRNHVIVINSDNIQFTGKKREQKIYYRHTGYTGKLKSISLAEQMKKDSRLVITKAVKGMLPSNTLGRNLLKNLKVLNGSDHKHMAQKPVVIDIN